MGYLALMFNSSTEPLSSAEVADALEVSVKTVTRMVKDGRLAPVKRLPGPRGAFLFNPAQVEAILANEPWEPAQ